MGIKAKEMDYHINDFKVGDIYEHSAGGFFMVDYINKRDQILDSTRVNSTEKQSHKLVYVKRVWFGDQK